MKGVGASQTLVTIYYIKQLRWSTGSVLAFGTQVRGFTPGHGHRIFRAKKILSTPSFGGEVKLSVPCRSFTACKRSLNVTWISAFRQNYLTFLAHSSTFRRWVLSRGDAWRRLVAKVGNSNQDRTISLMAAVRSSINKQSNTLNGITSQKTMPCTFTVVRSSHLTHATLLWSHKQCFVAAYRPKCHTKY